MSAVSAAARLATARRRGRPPAALLWARQSRMRLATFVALALYGTIRWGTLLHPAPTGRLLILLAIAVVVVTAGPWLLAAGRGAAAVLAAVAFVAMFPIAGIPWHWIWHVRIAVTADLIGNGLTALPHVYVPYSGHARPVTAVIVLGAAVLLFDSAFVLGFAPSTLGDLRRGAAALPLIALVVVPATLVHPSMPYLQGFLLFGLVAALVWGERLRPGAAFAACLVAAVAGIGGAIVAPRLDTHKPWVNYEALAARLVTTGGDSFIWQQQYGPLNWPRDGHEVLEVKATDSEYWKAENLDLFDGYAWSEGAVASDQPLPAPDPSSLRRFSQTIQVTIGDMRTSDVIAAGTAEHEPQDSSEQLAPGASPGTWVSAVPLSSGDSYSVSVYNPAPIASQMEHAGVADSPALAAYLSLELPKYPTPASDTPVPPSTIQFAPFHSTQPPVDGPSGAQATAVIAASPYGEAYRLAQTLARRAATPYAFVQAVMDYLRRGFRYDEDPPSGPYPLAYFLFDSKRGYCQQFSGAMALLLRMGGVPARVAAGFTSGTFDATINRYVVTDLDAHDWVEVWFPKYGWVRFDPTPASSDPARRSLPIEPALLGGAPSPNQGISKTPESSVRKAESPLGGASRPVGAHSGHGSLLGWWWIAAALLGLAGAGLGAYWWSRSGRPRGEDQLLTELERALARCRRPVSPGVTLAELEQRFGFSPAAVDYIRTLRLARFGDRAERPTVAQRRALRSALGAGLGVSGALRAMWALPPRRLTSKR